MDEKRPFKKGTSRVPLRGYGLPEARIAVLQHFGHAIDLPGIRAAEDAATKFAENAIGSFPVPLGVATNFIVNGQDRLVMMATEEKSVVAGASYAAKLCRENGGFTVEAGPNVMRGQVLLATSQLFPTDVTGRDNQTDRCCRQMAEVLDAEERPIRKHGGGLITDGFGNEVSVRSVDGGIGRSHLLAVDFQMNVGNAMGANVVTRFGEKLAKRLESGLNVKRVAVICSNDCASLSGPATKASASWPIALIGEDVAERILLLQRWAESDSSRAVTHNKGVMNGVSAVAQATGQDVRAIEAAFHSAAAQEAMPYGHSKPSTKYSLVGKNLEGRFTLRVPLGTVGGATGHPVAAECRRLMGIENVQDLAAIIGAVGLAQNFAALRSLASEGISEAHRRLKAK
jgi:hydroxymethylglutaryl-CoA reductase